MPRNCGHRGTERCDVVVFSLRHAFGRNVTTPRSSETSSASSPSIRPITSHPPRISLPLTEVDSIRVLTYNPNGDFVPSVLGVALFVAVLVWYSKCKTC
jgi:hypothetical protein